jgi:hypothetical protein
MSQATQARVTGSGDAAGMQGIVARLEADNPSWIVLFGAYTREFVAFPRFDVPGGAVITARHPDALPPRMRTLEAMARPAVTGRAPRTQPEARLPPDSSQPQQRRSSDGGPSSDVAVPNAVRIYDFTPGGKDYFQEHRDAADG